MTPDEKANKIQCIVNDILVDALSTRYTSLVEINDYLDNLYVPKIKFDVKGVVKQAMIFNTLCNVRLKNVFCETHYYDSPLFPTSNIYLTHIAHNNPLLKEFKRYENKKLANCNFNILEPSESSESSELSEFYEPLSDEFCKNYQPTYFLNFAIILDFIE